MKKVVLITDGSCIGNPGPGGWACILRFGTAKRELFGHDPHTTNNRMELMAPIQGLLALKEPCQVEITTDSEYVRQGITKWIIYWKRRHWWKKRRPVRNTDLWIELDESVAIHQTTWLWTKGHAHHEDNNLCDWASPEGCSRTSQLVAGRQTPRGTPPESWRGLHPAESARRVIRQPGIHGRRRRK